MNFLHATTVLILWLSPTSFFWHIFLTALIIASAWWTLRYQVFFYMPWSIIKIGWTGQDWQLELSNGAIVPAQLLPSTIMTVPLVLLHFRCGRWCRRSLILCPDSLGKDELRQLRFWLRFHSSLKHDLDKKGS
ncbi:hypothetical protein HUK38_11550 [Thiospirillum jenense]|uniref:Toxin CptA n=1 Tax=Thiospirillum jenense TaxID=1653858 RepID=A0A839HIG4_9GAMM|nr:protein YgfX [Thiospirillum jenense]MBB1126856.1 hypothetical protein [Thiospirillum jenense]